MEILTSAAEGFLLSNGYIITILNSTYNQPINVLQTQCMYNYGFYLTGTFIASLLHWKFSNWLTSSRISWSIAFTSSILLRYLDLSWIGFAWLSAVLFYFMIGSATTYLNTNTTRTNAPIFAILIVVYYQYFLNVPSDAFGLVFVATILMAIKLICNFNDRPIPKKQTNYVILPFVCILTFKFVYFYPMVYIPYYINDSYYTFVSYMLLFAGIFTGRSAYWNILKRNWYNFPILASVSMTALFGVLINTYGEQVLWTIQFLLGFFIGYIEMRQSQWLTSFDTMVPSLVKASLVSIPGVFIMANINSQVLACTILSGILVFFEMMIWHHPPNEEN